MFLKKSENSNRLFYCFLLVFAVLVFFSSNGALAADDPPPSTEDDVVAGCDPKVMDALKAKAEAKVAVDVAATEEIMTKPDSVLAMTCFDKASKASSKGAGKIFSGDFHNQSKGTVKAGLDSHYKNYTVGEGQGTDGSDADESFYDIVFIDMGGVEFGGGANAGVDVNAGWNPAGGDGGTAPGPVVKGFNCDKMDTVYNKNAEKPASKDTPYVGPSDLETGTVPDGAGEGFRESMEASKDQGIFQDLEDANANLPDHDVPSYTGEETSCEVRAKAGLIDESECEEDDDEDDDDE